MDSEISLIKVVAELFHGFLAAAPVFIDFDEALEVDLLAEEAFELFACLGTHALEGYALMSDDDSFLGLAFHVDDGLDAYEVLFLLETLHDGLYRVGDFLVVVEENLFADDFSDEEAGGFVQASFSK